MTTTTTTRATSRNISRDTGSPIRRAAGLCASLCVLVTANMAFALPTTSTDRDLNSPLTLTTTTTTTQGDLPTTTTTPIVRSARHESLD